MHVVQYVGESVQRSVIYSDIPHKQDELMEAWGEAVKQVDPAVNDDPIVSQCQFLGTLSFSGGVEYFL